VSIKKRFIAGAVCPKCGAMDKIVNYRDADKNYRECVSCGFRDEILIAPQARELETRVNRSEDEKTRDVQILEFPTKK